MALPKTIKEEKDLEPYERLFANTAYWKTHRRGISEPADRHRHGALRAEHVQRDFVQRDQEVFDSFGRRRVVPMRTFMERKGFILRPKFVFIDGRTGDHDVLGDATAKKFSTTRSRTRRRCRRTSS